MTQSGRVTPGVSEREGKDKDCQAEKNMDRDRRMMAFQNPKRRQNLGHFSCLTHNIHTQGKV